MMTTTNPKTGSHCDLQIAPLENDDIAPFSAILQESLNFPPLDEFDWLTRMGRENVRIAKLGSQVAGGAMVVPLGQSFGARFLPMAGIHGVAVAAQHRGKGIATRLMGSVVREAHENGCPLSVLYPATQPVYRSAGYEQAGVRVQYRAAVAGLASRNRSLPVRPYQPEDQEAIDAIYRRRALNYPGHVERTPWSWQRVISRWNRKTFGYVVGGGEGHGDLEGYVFFAKSEAVFPRYGLDVIDYGATTERAFDRLMTLLGDHRSMASELTWCGAPADPLLMRMTEQEHEVAWRMIWMLRIADVEKALTMRGYPTTTNAQLELRVRDELIPQNNASFSLTVENGHVGVRRDETPGHGPESTALDVSIHTLAPLYSGYFTATQLRAMGRLSGGDRAVQAADRVFAGPTPWMSDMF